MEKENEAETITEIRSYLDNFNKEIEPERNVGKETSVLDVENVSHSEGTFFVDETGQYYIQGLDGTVRQMQSNDERNKIMAILPDSGSDIDTLNVTKLPQDCSLQQQESTEILPGSNAFQTLAIVPSSENGSGVRYVVIMQRSENAENSISGLTNENKDDQDLAVYDFTEAEENTYVQEVTDDSDDKIKLTKLTPKKSQTVTQAHMCNYCNYTSPKRHMKSHSEERPHKCSVCERGFKTLASLQNHVNTHTGTKPHKCKFCEAAFTTSGELVRHVRYRHTHEKPHRCSECDYSSVELSKLKRHMRCHTGERPYQCPHCTYASPDTFKLKRHLRIHTGEKPYECDICHARFTQSNSLKAHRLIHTGNKPVFKCELCPTTCGRKTDLRIHVQKLHTSERPLKCSRCGKSFPDRYSYKLHAKSHEGEKCFRCDLCPYSSVSQRHLESHMLIHTDQKPFHCERCDKTFRQKQLLKRHQNLYHNPQYTPPLPREKTHECPQCDKAFRHKGNLIRHMAMHDPESHTEEKAIALKLGRQKRIQLLDGTSMDIESGIIPLQGQDGQQYVVIEVMVPDGDAPPLSEDSADVSLDNIIQFSNTLNSGQADKFTVIPCKKDQDTEIKKRIAKAQKDMQNCFGFNEDEDDENTAPDENEMLKY